MVVPIVANRRSWITAVCVWLMLTGWGIGDASAQQTPQPSKEYIRLNGRLLAIEYGTPAPTSGFTLGFSQSSQSGPQGGSAAYSITSGATGGFANAIMLSAVGLPSGVTPGFQPASVTPGSSATLTLTIVPTVPPDTYPFSVKGVADGADDVMVSGTLIVTPHVPTGLTISPSVSAMSVVRPGAVAIQFEALDGAVAVPSTWSLDPVDPANGTITTNGLYTAPATITAERNVTVRAEAMGHPTITATRNLRLLPHIVVNITQTNQNVAPSQVINFAATVTWWDQSSAVTWSISPNNPANDGTINPTTGVYAAPATISTQHTVTVTATSAEDPTRSDAIVLTLVPPPVGIEISQGNQTLGPGASFDFDASLNGVLNSPDIEWEITPAVPAVHGTINVDTGVYSAPQYIPILRTVTVIAKKRNEPAFPVDQVSVTLQPGPNIAPVLGSVTPVSGSGMTQQFTASFSDANGYLDLVNALFHIGNSPSELGCTVRYNGGLQLLGDDGSTWIQITTQNPTSAQNARCSINPSLTSATGDGINLTLQVSATFKAAFVRTAPYNVYLSATDNRGLSVGPVSKGTYQVVQGQAPPGIQSFTPTTGSGMDEIFTLTLSDADGAANIKNAYLTLRNQGLVNSGCIVWMDRSAGVIRLNNTYDPVVANWPSASFLQSSNPSQELSTTRCTLRVQNTSYSTSGNTLTWNVSLSFTAAFVSTSVPKEVAVQAEDFNGAGFQFIPVGTFTVNPNNSLPTIQSTGLNGTGPTAAFATAFRDLDGAADIRYAYLLVGTSTSNPSASCLMRYDANGGQPAVALYTSGAWSTPRLIGSGANVSNAQCTVKPASSNFAWDFNNLSVNFSVEFSGTFLGVKNVYLGVQDFTTAGSTVSYTDVGDWTVTPGNSIPVNSSVTPSSGAGSLEMFRFKYTDADGYADLSTLEAGFNTTAAYANGCLVKYTRLSNQVQLYQDNGSSLSAGAVLGSATTLSNSRCSLQVARSGATTTATTIELRLAIQFTSWPGNKSTYMRAYDVPGGQTALQQKGTWSVSTAASAPTYHGVFVQPVGIYEGRGMSQAFRTTVEDPNNNPSMFINEIHSIQYRFTPNGSTTANICHFQYFRQSGAFVLYANDGVSWAGVAFPGEATVLQNSQCSIARNTVTATMVGDYYMELGETVVFKPAFQSLTPKLIQANGLDTNGATIGWATTQLSWVVAP